jgi:protein ImuA
VSESLSVSSLHLSEAVWRADSLAGAAGVTVASGHAVLDAQLPGGGWPEGGMCEILQANGEHNEWRLLLPALKRTVAASVRHSCVVLVGAPHIPFGPGLAAQGLDARRLVQVVASVPGERLWAAEQALRCAMVQAVLAWLPQAQADQLRRLQMAAHANSKLLFVMRPAQARVESSPAVLRLLLASQPQSDALLLHILKRRGRPLAQPLALPARTARLSALLATWCGPVRPAAVASAAPSELVADFLQGVRDVVGCIASAA